MFCVLLFLIPLILYSERVGSSSIANSIEILSPSTFVTKKLISLNKSKFHNLFRIPLVSSPGNLISFPFLSPLYDITVLSLKF